MSNIAISIAGDRAGANASEARVTRSTFKVCTRRTCSGTVFSSISPCFTAVVGRGVRHGHCQGNISSDVKSARTVVGRISSDDVIVFSWYIHRHGRRWIGHGAYFHVRVAKFQPCTIHIGFARRTPTPIIPAQAAVCNRGRLRGIGLDLDQIKRSQSVVERLCPVGNLIFPPAEHGVQHIDKRRIRGVLVVLYESLQRGEVIVLAGTLHGLDPVEHSRDPSELVRSLVGADGARVFAKVNVGVYGGTSVPRCLGPKPMVELSVRTHSSNL